MISSMYNVLILNDNSNNIKPVSCFCCNMHMISDKSNVMQNLHTSSIIETNNYHRMRIHMAILLHKIYIDIIHDMNIYEYKIQISMIPTT